MKKLLVAALLGAGFACSANAATVFTTSFEAPSVGAGFSYNPVVADTTFASISGIAGNGSAFGYNTTDGTQVGFLQGNSSTNGVISFTLNGLTAGQSYATSFLLGARPGYSILPVTVSFNGLSLGTFTPGSTFALVSASNFVAGPGANLLQFAGQLGAGDLNAAIDAVTVTSVPEASTWAMMIGGFGLVGGAMRRRGRKAAIAALA